MANPLNNKIFQDAQKAREWLELLLWPDGRVCGYCGTLNNSTPIKGRDGYYQCNECRKQFTVMVGTVFERSHIPLNKWLMAAFLICGSKKGISAHQLHRMLGITYKSAWFMDHRLREAMAPGNAGPIGGEARSWKPTQPLSVAKRRTSTPASATRRTSAALASRSCIRLWNAAAKSLATTLRMYPAKPFAQLS